MKFFDEIKDLRRYFSNTNADARRITFYAESAFYYKIFKQYINYILENSDYDICYVTSNALDPIFGDERSRIKKFYSNLLFPFIAQHTDARALIYTMDDLGNFYIKRSIKPGVEHIFTFHGPYSTTMVHRKEAFDHYDTIFCIGNYQKEEILKREQLHSLPSKNLIEVGYPHLDEVTQEWDEHIDISKRNTILIAPSWHEGNIFETCIVQLVENLLASGFEIIVRPHDELLKRNPKLIFSVRDHFKNEPLFSLDLALPSNDCFLSSSLLITDWSGISFEWALASKRPVLYINTKMKVRNKDYMDLSIVPIEIRSRNLFGKSIDIKQLNKVGEYARNLLKNKDHYTNKIVRFGKQNIYNQMNSAKVGGQYIINILENTP